MWDWGYTVQARTQAGNRQEHDKQGRYARQESLAVSALHLPACSSMLCPACESLPPHLFNYVGNTLEFSGMHMRRAFALHTSSIRVQHLGNDAAAYAVAFYATQASF